MEVGASEARISQVVYECELYLVRSGVPRRKREGMLSELEQHLREADRSGKPAEAVVGEDIRAFAEAWAEENRPPRELGKRLLVLTEYLTVAVAVLAVLTHLWFRTLSFDVDLWMILPVGIFVYSISVMLFPTLAVIEFLKPRWKSHLAVVVLAAATVLIPAGVVRLAFGSTNATFFEWSWTATVASALVALVVYGLRKRFVPDARALIRDKFR